jgi:hypothetical protein
MTPGRRPQRHPDPESFRSGDLLWPKPDGAVIPYALPARPSVDDEASRWSRQRDDFVASVRMNEAAGAEERASAQRLHAMTFEEFRFCYYGGVRLAGVDSLARTLPIYVGHVAIVSMAGPTALVVEAVSPEVRQIPYADWLDGRGGDAVWHGRLAHVSDADRVKFARQAAAFEGRPYDFFNFDLSDDAAFYCSKLAWLSAHRALSSPTRPFALDDDPSPRRHVWYSPKQLMGSPHVTLLFEPGLYSLSFQAHDVPYDVERSG